MPRFRSLEQAVAGLLIAASLAGCQNNTQKGAAVGGIGGAALGAVIGNQSGHAGEGALVGALAGGALGGLIGNSEDEAEKQDAQAHQAAAAQAAYRRQRAITNSQVIEMSQQNVSDDIICHEIRTHGGRFDTAPEAIIQLQKSGVSNSVIALMQDYGDN